MASGHVFPLLLCLSGGLWTGMDVGSGFSEACQEASGYLKSSFRVITCDDYNTVQRLNCESGVIVVDSVLYGRTNRQTCSDGRPENQLTNTDCSQKGAFDVIKKRCDGRKVCEINSNTLHSSDPCYGTYKYIDTKYTCIPAVYTLVCSSSLANLQCEDDTVIKVIGADYGRTDPTICSFQLPASQVQNTQCTSPSSKVADICDGKTSCSVPATGSVFGDPCFGTFKYLQVAHVCERAVSKENH